MPQFCLLFHAILQSWRPKGGAMAQWPPLNTPLHTGKHFCGALSPFLLRLLFYRLDFCSR